MDQTNLITILKLIAEQKAVAPASGQTLIIWGMVISALSGVLAAVAAYISRSAERKAGEAKEKIGEAKEKIDASHKIAEKIEKDVNSDRTLMQTEMRVMNERLLGLEKINATLVEEKRGHDLREATALVPVFTSAPAVRLTDEQLSEMSAELNRMLAERKSKPMPAPKA